MSQELCPSSKEFNFNTKWTATSNGFGYGKIHEYLCCKKIKWNIRLIWLLTYSFKVLIKTGACIAELILSERRLESITDIQAAIQKLQHFIKKTNILLVAFEIVPFALNTTICTIKKIIEWRF